MDEHYIFAPINFFWVKGLHWESTSRIPNSKNFWESGRFPRFSDLESQLTSSFIATSRFVSRMSAEEDAMVARRALIEILHGMYLGLIGIGMMTYSKWWCWETIRFGLPTMDGMFVSLLFLQGPRKQSCCSYKDVANLCEWVEWFPSFCLADVVFGGGGRNVVRCKQFCRLVCFIVVPVTLCSMMITLLHTNISTPNTLILRLHTLML